LLGESADSGRERRLEQRVGRLRRQLVDLGEQIAPGPQRAPDPLEAASRRAHAAFVDVTRARLAEAPRPRERRPFVSAGGEDGPDCQGLRRRWRQPRRVGADPRGGVRAAEIRHLLDRVTRALPPSWR
jgi:hypothetical protein